MGSRGRATKKITPEQKALAVRISKRIKAERVARNITQQELAEMIGNGTDCDDIYYLERKSANKNLWLVYRICQLFGISLEAVISEDDYYVKTKVE